MVRLERLDDDPNVRLESTPLGNSADPAPRFGHRRDRRFASLADRAEVRRRFERFDAVDDETCGAIQLDGRRTTLAA